MAKKVVAHYLHGTLVRGITRDFQPNRLSFHIEVDGGEDPVEIRLSDLKAVFFVKDMAGDRYYQERHGAERSGLGKRVRIRFLDGEVVFGYTDGFSGSKSAFFVYPADARSNNEKIYVIRSATDEISFSDVRAPAQ